MTGATEKTKHRNNWRRLLSLAARDNINSHNVKDLMRTNSVEAPESREIVSQALSITLLTLRPALSFFHFFFKCGSQNQTQRVTSVVSSEILFYVSISAFKMQQEKTNNGLIKAESCFLYIYFSNPDAR